MKTIYRLPGAMIISVVGLLVSGCAAGKASVDTATEVAVTRHLPALTDTVVAATKPLPSPTPEIFNSGDADLYDNFNDSQYDGTINDRLWRVSDPSAKDIFQKSGILSVIKNNGPDECLGANANQFNNYKPELPFFVQADVKVEKQLSEGLAGYWVGGYTSEKGFMSSCSIGLDSQDQLVAVCVNHWWDGKDKENPVSEHYATAKIPVDYSEWHTFRVDYDPRLFVFTYFIDNENVGSYQVLDTETIRKASFTLYLDVCLIKGESYTGNYDNVRIGKVAA